MNVTAKFTLGGFEDLQKLKMKQREILGLPPLPEDSIKVVRSMRAASPPASAMELIEQQQQQQKRGRRSRRPLMKQDSLDTYNERDPFKNDDIRDDEEDSEDADSGIEGEVDPLDRDVIIQPPPPPPPLKPLAERISFPKGLPWAPKVSDTETLVGLPRPIHESVKTLKQHKYISIAEVQIKRENELQECPMTLIALLKLLLAAAPTSKAKTDSINILADVLPEEMPISILDYPYCVVHQLPELTAESLMLVVFKSAPILKRALKAKQAMMQLYVLKLLKIQTKYLGRQWRKSNMKTMSAIYQKVRHRLNDDWAYGNDIDARPWDFQAEECALRESIEKFNNRRYDKNQKTEFTPVDNCLQSVLGQKTDIPEDFHYSYEMWLEREVFSQPIKWEELLETE
ncbi:STRP2 protein, partial [Polypterus senegalus]